MTAGAVALSFTMIAPRFASATGGVGHPNLARGISANATSGTGSIDTVNLFNGGLGVSIPVGPSFTVSEAVGYQISLQYSSGVWDVNREFHCDANNPLQSDASNPEYINQPSSMFNAGLGWSSGFGLVITPSSPLNSTDQNAYIDPSGATHYFYDTLHEGETPTTGVSYTRDGSYLKRTTELVGEEIHVHIFFPNGEIHTFRREEVYDPEGEWRLWKINDRFGEEPPDVEVTRTLASNLDGDVCDCEGETCWYEVSMIRDGAGRQHQLVSWSPEGVTCPSPTEDLPQLTANADRSWYLRMVRMHINDTEAEACYRLDYETATINPPPLDCRYSYTNPPGSLVYEEVRLLSTVVFPDGTVNPCSDSVTCIDCSEYRFEYNEDVYPSEKGGRLDQITLPTGGMHQYAYREYEFPDGNSGSEPWEEAQIVLQRSLGIRSRTLQDLDGTGAVWTYTPENILDSNFDQKSVYRIVTDPEGDETQQFFNTDALPRTATGEFLRGWEYGLPVKTVGQNHLSRLDFVGTVTTGTQLRANYLDFTRDVLPDYTGDPGTYSDVSRHFLNSNRRVEGRETRFTDDLLMWADPVAYAFTRANLSRFDGLGHFRRTEFTSNFGDLADGIWADQNLRSTFIGFNPGATETSSYPLYCVEIDTNEPCDDFDYVPWPADREWIINLFDKRTTSLDSSTQLARYDFDPDTGFLEAVRVLAGDGSSGLSTDDILVTRSRVAKPGGFDLTERHYGADSQVLPIASTFNTPAQPIYLKTDEIRHGTLHQSAFYRPGYPTIRVGGYLADRDIDPQTGWVVKARNDARYPTEITNHDLLGRVRETVSGQPGEARTTTTYTPAYPGNAFGGHAAIRSRAWGPGDGSTEELDLLLADSITVLDGFGRPWRSCVAQDEGDEWNLELTGYDLLGRVESSSVAYEVTSCMQNPASTHETVIQRDRFGRPTRVTAPDGTATLMGYLGEREAVRTEQMCTTGASNCLGGFFESVATTERFDSFGRLRKVLEPGAGTGALTSSFTYDVGGRMTRASLKAGLVTQHRDMVYDNAGMLIEERIPERLGQPIDLDHDPLGNVIRSTRNGGVLDFDYDDAARPTTTKWTPTGGSATTLQSSTYFNLFAISWNSARLKKTEQLTIAESGDGPEVRVGQQYSYAGVGSNVNLQTTSVSVTNGGVPLVPARNFAINYTWDPLGNMASIAYPDLAVTAGDDPPSREIRYVFDNGWPEYVIDFSGQEESSELLATLSYHPNGTLASVAHSNGITDTLEQDLWMMGRPSGMATEEASTGTDLWSTGLISYDGMGSIHQMGGDSYRYDKVGRLTQSEVTMPGYGVPHTYTFDAFGNLTDLATPPLKAIFHIPVDPTSNRVSTASYDWSGNMTSMASSPSADYYRWDPLGRLALVDGPQPTELDSTYGYDSSGERVVTYGLGQPGAPFTLATYTLRDLGGRPVREYQYTYDGELEWSRDHVFLGRNSIASEASTAWLTGGQILRHHRDHLGSLRLLTDPGGTVVAEQAFEPFGVAWSQGMEEPLQFTGHEREPGNGWDYMHARYYTPEWGRFWSVDPIGGTPGVPQSWNGYAYVMGNPVNLIDPYGLSEAPIPWPGEFTISTLDFSNPPGFDGGWNSYSNQDWEGHFLNFDFANNRFGGGGAWSTGGDPAYLLPGGPNASISANPSNSHSSPYSNLVAHSQLPGSSCFLGMSCNSHWKEPLAGTLPFVGPGPLTSQVSLLGHSARGIKWFFLGEYPAFVRSGGYLQPRNPVLNRFLKVGAAPGWRAGVPGRFGAGLSAAYNGGPAPVDFAGRVGFGVGMYLKIFGGPGPPG